MIQRLQTGIIAILQWLDANFAFKNEDLEERRKAVFVAAFCFVGGGAASFNLIQLHAIPPVPDYSLPKNVMLDGALASGVLIGVTFLIHMRCMGLTTYLKFGLISFWVVALLVLDVFYPKHQWIYAYSPLLTFCTVLASDKDARLFNMLSLVICLLVFVYGGLRTFVLNCLITGVDLWDADLNCDEVTPDRSDIMIQWSLQLLVVLGNYIFVRLYALNAQTDARTMEDCVDVATAIANKLVNFDLPAAEELLEEASEKSPLHQPLTQLLENLRSYRGFLPYALFQSQSSESSVDPPNMIMAEAMKGQKMSRQHALMAVRGLREESYSLKDFHDDIRAAFPELQLYALETDTCSSGRTGFAEFQRTMGAMYSIYCLARLDIDGKEVMSFGVDENWRPRSAPHGPSAEKMKLFYDRMDWAGLEKLLLRANILASADLGLGPGNSATLVRSMRSFSAAAATGSIAASRADARPKINSDRMLALIVLTAVHDVMKNNHILPTVQQRHAPFNGLPAETKIADHDTALAYVMECFPAMLPSYFALEPGQRAPILFSQSKMGFNNGWLVQGEAPPGALFSTFKRVIMEGGAGQSDISFYFVHWLTDLAGAEPHGSLPWPGADKLVSKFPLKVLKAFLESFSFVDRLANQTEVDVMEDYLECRWQALGPPSSHVEEGLQLAARRLALMAQGFEAKAVDAFRRLSPADRDVIAREMAQTGCRQQFRDAPGSVRSAPRGPALLVYYAPALVQRAGATQVELGLLVLASVYRAARALFPPETSATERTAVVRIDALKVLTPQEIVAAGEWHLKKNSDFDAEVVQGPCPPDGPALAPLVMPDSGPPTWACSMDAAEDPTFII